MVFHKSNIVALLILISSFQLFASDLHKEQYRLAFQEQLLMLQGKQEISFKRAVFLTENSYYEGKLSYQAFCDELDLMEEHLFAFIEQYEMSSYKTAGNWAVFTFLSEPLEINGEKAFSYDYDDFFGEADLSKMFVTKLMQTQSGNCHSLPYFYKILCDELGAEAHLALAPNHIYIKHRSEKGSWTNLELTNYSFPEDQWIIKDLAIPQKAIEEEVYLQALTPAESIAMSLFDLANGYEAQFGMDPYYLEVIDSALSYFPKCLPLWMNKANYYAHQIEVELRNENPKKEVLMLWDQAYESVNQKIIELGHEAPSEEWEAEYEEFVAKEKRKSERKKAKYKKREEEQPAKKLISGTHL